MHEFACLNHRINRAAKIHLPAISSAAFYGRGIFTTIAIYESMPFQWRAHWRRLNENATTVGIDLSGLEEKAIGKSLAEIINHNKVKNGRARITFFDEAAAGIWQLESERRTSFLIVTADFRPVPEVLRLTVSPYRINSKSPLAGVKSCNYLENLLTLEEAKRRGFDEALRLNEAGEIASAVMGNIFWTRNHEIFTPPAAAGALKGTTREFVLEKFPVTEKRASLAELNDADEIFVTSAGVGVMRVTSLERRVFGGLKIFSEIRRTFSELAHSPESDLPRLLDLND